MLILTLSKVVHASVFVEHIDGGSGLSADRSAFYRFVQKIERHLVRVPIREIDDLDVVDTLFLVQGSAISDQKSRNSISVYPNLSLKP